jgi:hypothetical protein
MQIKKKIRHDFHIMRLFYELTAKNNTHHQRTLRPAENQLVFPMDKLHYCGEIQGNNKADDIC